MGKAKTLNNVVINMTLKSTQTRARLSTSSEDLAVQMGKINKWYDSLVPTGGVSGNILEWDSDGVAKWVSPSFLDEKVKSTLLAQSTAEGSYRPTFVTGAGTGGVNIIDSFKVNHTPGTTSAVGNTRLVLGNATASGTANNEEGQLKLYSSGTSFHTLKGTTVSSEVIHVLPSTAGTILNHMTTTYTQTVASSVTGAYEIGKIKINGTTTTIYGHDVDTTYTASDGIKIESNVIKHTNAITSAASVFKKISYDAQGHITGTANVTASDIPALNYIVKPGQVGSASRPIYINNSSVPTQCDTPASGAYWAGVPYVGSNGVMEIGKYIDFHGTNTTTNDYDYRITAETQTLYFAPKSSGDATYNLIRMQSPDYNQIQFQTTKSGKAYTSTGIVAYPLTTSGQTMLIQSDGNTVVGGGESPRTLYSNSYDNMDTAENETLYLASDSSEIHFITNCQAYSGRKVLKVQDGQLVKSGGQWISARDNAPVYANKPNAQDGGYYPAWFAKTKSGGWSMGVLSAQDNLYITYTTDTDYSGGTNNNTYQVQFQNKSGTVALTSDLAGYVPMETVTTDTSADNYFTKTEWVNWNKNAGTSTTNLPTANWGILLTKALPSVQVFIPDNASGLYFRRKADASTAATAWWGITGTAGNTYNLDNFISLSSISATNSGSGNAVTSISYSNGVITATKGNSFLPLAGGTVTGTLVLSKTQDAAVDANNSPALIVGGLATGTHLELDCNEIMAKATGTTGADLYINSGTGAGKVYINDNLACRLTATPTSGQIVVTDGTTGGVKTTGYTTSSFLSSSTKYAGSASVGGPADKVKTSEGTSDGARPVFYAYLGDNQQVVYHSSFTYNPTGGVLTATRFAGNADTATTATKLGTANKGSATKGIYLSGGTPQEMTYSLNSTVNSGTANCVAYYSGANAISSAAKVTYVNANNSASTPATVAGLHIESPTYGNTAANMIGGVAGVFSYGDGGPQIRFKDASSNQAGALIFTADDVAAAGASWHFVSNQTDWNVISMRFHAKTSISIGTDKPSTSYNLTVNGTSYFNNTITIKGTSSGNASIYYASYGNARNYPSIRFYDGDVNGQGIQVGGGGLTVLGGGESAQAVFDNLSTLGWSAADEVAIVASDGPIYFMSNCDTFANRKSINIDTSGYLNTGYINMNISDQDNQFSTASSIVYSNSDKYLRRVSLTTLGSTLGPYVGPYVTNVSDGSVIHQNNYNSAGTTRPVHRFIRSLRTNKLAFTLPANITMEYSTNAGSSWASFGYTDAQKAGPFISRHFAGSILIGAPTSTDFPNVTTSMQTRITITNDSRDCMIDQFYIWMSTAGHGTTVDIQYTTQSAKTTWVDWRTGVGLAGWSGPNVINVSELRYGNTIYSIRFIFKITSVSADYKTQRGTIYDIQAYGAMGCWTSKNNMMKHDSLYTWDHNQIATFPAEIRVPTQMRVYHGNYGTILRSDGTDTYILLTDSGSAESGGWNNLRPFQISNSTGMVYLKEGAQVSSTSYGALSVIRAGSANNAGIKFYNNGSTYLGSLALGTANGRFIRYKTDESTAYTIIDTSLLNVTESATLGLDGGTNAFGYVSGLTKADWNFQQTDGTIIRQYYNANWKTEIFMDYRTGQMSSRGKNNGTWQDWRIHLDSGNYSSYALPLSGGTMSGTITHPANTVAINLRDDATSTWQNTIMTQSAGDEAVVFANANARTSWMFVNGEDSIAHPENNRWQSLTPALQIKGGCVAIGKLIPSGTTPTTKLDVAGDASISGTLYIDSKVAARHTATPVDGRIMIADGTTGGIKSSSYTIATSVPSGAVFTDTHVKVTSNTSTKAYLIATTTSPAGTAVEGVGDANVYLATTNHVLYAPGFSTTGSNKGYRAYDQAGTQYAIIYDNGSNLWVGAEASNVYHHKGQTYISTGWSGTLPTTTGGTLTGHSTIFISIPTYTATSATAGSWNHAPKYVLHSGNFTTTGSGNAITSVAFTNEQLTFTKGSTFALSTHTHSQYYDSTISRTANTVLAAPNGSSGTATFRSLVAADIPTGINITGNAKTTGTRWTAVSQGQKWSRLYYVWAVNGTEGTSGILSISATRGNTVYNATFLITSSHAGSRYVHCIELDSCNYSQIKVRTVCKSDATYYFEIYDTASSIAAGTTQNWHCCFISFAATNITTYTSFTDGTTIPSGYSASNEFTTTAHAITMPYNTGKVVFDGGTGMTITAPTDSGWARGLDYYVGSTWYGGFGANGGSASFDSLYIGKYNDKAVSINPSNKTSTFYGLITAYRESATTDDLPAGIVFSNKDTTTGLTYSDAHIYAYNDHANPTYGENLVINASGSLFIGAGESADYHYAAIKSSIGTNEDIYMTADRYVYIQGCGNAIAARKGMMVYTTDSNHGNYHQILPTVADTATNNVGSIGSSSYKWYSMYASNYYGEFDCLNEVADNTSYAMVLAMNPSTHQPNTLRKTPNAVISFKNGTASEEGWAQITLGNGTASGTAGNSTGWIKLFSPSSGSHYITGASTTSAITHTLPAVSGTVLNSGNYLQYTRSIQKLYAAKTTKGWRRILTISASSSSGFTIGRYEFHFTRQWNNGAPETFGVRVICNYNTPIIRVLYVEQNSQILTDFRVARSSDSTKIYFEVWYNATTKNDFSVRYIIQDPYPIPHDWCTFPTETDGSSAGSSFLPVVSDSPTAQATIAVPAGGISQFNLKQAADFNSGYYGMADGVGSDASAIRTTSAGLLPYQSGDSTSGGHCNLGTSGWYFANAYINRVYGNTADFECFQARHTNEFSMKQISATYIWFNYRLITDDKQGYTTNPTNPINEYYFGCGKARDAMAKVVTSGMRVYPGAASATSYSTTLQSTSLTANRTILLPDTSGALGVANIIYNTPTNSSTTGITVSAMLSDYDYFTIIIGQVGSNAQKTTSAIVPAVAGTHYFMINTLEALGSGGGIIYPAGVNIVQNTSNVTFTLGINRGITIPSSGSSVSVTSATAAYIKMIIGHKS